ncbi:MAG: hypothetical protein LBE18_12885 [Planctomycetaceae bacterium]|jgi:O-antigen/teichoic acid export membrane protein|nr:hypothetical protein [Planctomycetaceae bacterium]
MTATNESKKHITSLLGGAGLNIINLCIGIIVGLSLTPFLVESLGVRYYGINEIIATFVGCFAVLDLGIDSAVSRFFTLHYSRNEKKECLEIANTAFFIFLLLSVVGMICIILIALGIYFIYPGMADRTLFFHLMLINGLAFELNFGAKVFFGIVNGTMNQHLTSSRDIFIRLVWVMLTFAVVYCGGRLYSISFINLGISVFNIFLMFWLAKYVFPEFIISRLLFNIEWIRKLFSFAFSTFIVFIGDMIATRSGIFVIGIMISVELAAPFIAVTVKLSELFTSLMQSISGGWLVSWLTYLHANNEKKMIDDSMKLAYKLCTYSASFMFFGIIVWSPCFICRWVGESFLVAYDSLVIIALEHWIIFSFAPNTKFLFAVARHRLLAYCNLVAAFIQVFMMIIFVKLGWGITGVALGYLLVSIPVRGIIIPIYVSRIRQTSLFNFYFNILRYMLISLLGFVIPYIISQKILIPEYRILFLVGLLSAVSYGLFVILFGFDKTEKHTIKELLMSLYKRVFSKAKN